MRTIRQWSYSYAISMRERRIRMILVQVISAEIAFISFLLLMMVTG